MPISNTKFLTINQQTPDKESGWRFVAANIDNTAIVASDFPTARGDFTKRLNDVGSGRISIPKGDPGMDYLFSNIPLSRVATFMRVYLFDRYQFGFFPSLLGEENTDDEGSLSSLSGPGPGQLLKEMIVRPFEWPFEGSTPWIFGSTDNVVSNGTMEDGSDVIQNPTGSDGNKDGKVIGWNFKGDATAKAVNDPGKAYGLNEWAIEVTPTNHHAGISQSVSITPGKIYHIRARVFEPTGAGHRYTIGTDNDDMAAIGITYPNNYAYKGDIYAELDNVARSVDEDGCPGGASDGTYQVLDIEFLAGPEDETVTISIMDDLHPSCPNYGTHPVFYVGDVTIEGWGIGLEPWVAFQDNPDNPNHEADSFRKVLLSDGLPTYAGSDASMRLSIVGKFGGIEQTVSVSSGQKYTAYAHGFLEARLTGDSMTFEVLSSDGSVIYDQDVQPMLTGIWHEFKVEFTAGPGEEQVLLRFAYAGPNNPNYIYVDGITMVPGLPAATPGTIMNMLMASIQGGRGIHTMLQKSWYTELDFVTSLFDSKGSEWNGTVSLDINPGTSLYELVQRFVALGYEWEVAPVNFSTGGDTGFEVNLYNQRTESNTDGVSNNLIYQVGTPVIRDGDGVSTGSKRQQNRRPNLIFAIGQDGQYTEVFQEPFEGVGGYKEAYGTIEAYINVSDTTDSTTLNDYAKSRLAEEKARENSLKLNMVYGAELLPLFDFKVGDSLYVDMDIYPDPDQTTPRRIAGVTATFEGEGSQISFSVDIERVFYTDEAIILAAIAQLQERSPGSNDNKSPGSGSVSGTGTSVGSGTGGGGSAAIADHTHPVGDISGSLQGDVVGVLNVNKVIKVQGISVDSTTPTQGQGWEWDNDSSTMTPIDQVHNLDDLLDVNVPTPADEDILEWDSGAGEYALARRRFDTDDDVNVLAEVSLSSWEEAWAVDGYNGLFEWLGTIDGTEPFVKPTDQAKIVTTQSTTVGADTADRAIDQSFDFSANASQTTNVVNSWWKVDLGVGKSFRLDRFGTIGSNFISDQRHLRIFRIEGSNDDSNWTTIIDVDGIIVTSTVGGGTWDSWVSQEVAPAAWRYFRLTQYGLNAKGNNILHIGDLEMWGAYFYPTPDRLRTGDVVMFDGERLVPYRLIEETTWQDTTDPLAALVSTRRLYADEDREIISIRASVDTPASGGSVTFDVNVDSASILDATKLVVADLANQSPVAYPAVQTWAKDSYMTVDIDTASGAAGGATVVIRWRKVRP